MTVFQKAITGMTSAQTVVNPPSPQINGSRFSPAITEANTASKPVVAIGKLVQETPPWALFGSVVDMDFANGRYFGDLLPNLLSITNSTGGYVTNADGSLTLVPANTLRIGVGTGLLVEQSSANSLLQSNTPASMSPGLTTVSATQNITDPAVVANNGWTLAQTGGNGSDSRLQTNLSVANDSTSWTASAYFLKTGAPSTYPAFIASLLNGTGVGTGAVLNTQTGAFVFAAGFSGAAGVVVTSAGNYWRVTITIANNSSGNNLLLYQIYPSWNNTGTSAKSTVSGGSVGYAFGQIENLVFATSYIPTTGNTATRSADNIVTMGLLLTSFQGVAGAALVATSGLASQTTFPMMFGFGTNSGLYYNNVGFGKLTFSNSSVSLVDGTVSSLLTAHVAGMTFDQKGRSICLDSGTVASDANSIFTGSLNSAWLGSNILVNSYLNGYTTRFTTWNARLPDSYLQYLTGPPSWVNAGASVDLDFSNGNCWGGLLGDINFNDALKCTRAQTVLSYAQDALGNLVAFGADSLRVTSNGLLIEQASTNLAIQSVDFTNVAWALTNATAVTGVSDPLGTTTAVTLNEGTNTGAHRIEGNAGISFTSGTTYTFSVFAKKGTQNLIQLSAGLANFSGGGFVNFDLSAGAVVGSGGTFVSSGIQPYANGWYLCWFSAQATATSAGSSQSYSMINANNAVRNVSYTGISQTVLIFGSQVEALAFPTSYIPTTSASVTRAADSIAASQTLATALSYPIGSVYYQFNLNSLSAGSNVYLDASGSTGSFGVYINSSAVPTSTLTNLLNLTNSGVVAAGVQSMVSATFQSGNYQIKTGTSGTGSSSLVASPLAGTSPYGIGSNTGFGFFNGYMQRLSTSLNPTLFSTTAPAWTLANAIIDLNFASSQYYNSLTGSNSVTNNLSCTRASPATTYAVDSTGNNLVAFAANTLRITSAGLLVEQGSTNLALWSRDMTQSGTWTAVNMTTALNATGADGTANAATTLTASAINATILQIITLSLQANTYSVWLKRGSGSGTVNISNNGGISWTPVTLTSSFQKFTVEASVLNPSIGIQITTNGDSVVADFNQLEALTFATSPIPTTTATVTRSAEYVVMSPVVGSIFAGSAFSVYAKAGPTQSYAAFPRIIGGTDGTSGLPQIGNATTGIGIAPSTLSAVGSNISTGVSNIALGCGPSARSIVGNGGTVVTDSTTEVSSGPYYVGSLNGNNEFNGPILRIALWNSKLADATLKTLSSS